MTNEQPPLDPAEPALPDTPYVGLVPYEEDDAAYFFGRDDEKRIVSGNIRASDLTLVYGESGVGKTSLLRAGVVHQLRTELRERRQLLGGRALYSVCVFATWRDEPLPVLMEAIRSSVVEASGHEVAPWSAAEPVTETLRSWTEHARTLLVVLDQFEDYFLYHPEDGPDGDGLGNDGTVTFGEVLPAIANDPNLRVHLLLSIREDALGKLDRFKGHIPRLFANYFRVEHLTRRAAREAIEGPVREWNHRLPPDELPYALEPALVDAVIESAATGELAFARPTAGANVTTLDRGHVEAPFLQLVLERLWRATVASGSRELTAARLEQLGGARAIVENHLLDALAALTPDERATAAAVFRFLVTRSKTKIAHPASDLVDWTSRPETEIVAVLDKLCRGESGRILRRIPPPPTGNGATRYELFHDLLAEPILEWRREYEQDRRRRAAVRRFAQVGGGLLALVGIFAALGVWALVQRSDARSASRAATSIALASAARGQLGDHIERSLLLGLEAYRANPTAEAASAMTEALTAARRSGAETILRSGNDSGVRAISFSPDGRTLAAVGTEGWIHLWDTRELRELGIPLIGHTGEVWGLAFSPDGATLASAGFDGTVRFWSVPDRRQIGEALEPGLGALRTVAFSPDGRVLAVAGSDDTVRLLDARSLELLNPPLEGHEAEVVSIAFSQDGRVLASGGYDRTVRLWNVGTHAPLGKPLAGHDGEVWTVAFSPDGQMVASGGRDGTARLWSVRTRRALGSPLDGDTGQVWSVAFSPNGRTLASSGFDDTVRLWDTRTHEQLGQPLLGHSEGVISVAFRPDGTLASSSFDGTTRLWNVRRRPELGSVFRGHTDRVKSVVFSPDGSFLASAGFDRTIRLWNVLTRKPVRQFRGGGAESVESLAFSPDGDTLASAEGDGAIRLWRVPDGRLAGTLRGHAGAVHDLAFSPNASTLASVGIDGTARLWSLDTQRQLGEPLSTDKLPASPAWSVAFSPDGRTLVYSSSDLSLYLWDVETLTERQRSGGLDVNLSLAFSPDGDVLGAGRVDGDVWLWDVQELSVLASLRGHQGRVEAVSFSPGGETLASAGDDGTVRLWSVSGRRQLGQPLADHAAPVFSVAFSPDGRSFASGGDDRLVRLWEGIRWRDRADLEEQVCSLVAGNLTEAEWDELAPGLEHRATCAT